MASSDWQILRLCRRHRLLLAIVTPPLVGFLALQGWIQFQLYQPRFRSQPVPQPVVRQPPPPPPTHWVEYPESEPIRVRTESTPESPSSPDAFVVPPGFQVERLFTVPPDTLGSWVSLAVDPLGRLVACAERDGGLVRITPAPLGTSEPTRVERLSIPIPAAQGLLFAFGSLYASTDSGLFRIPYDESQDQFGTQEKIATFAGGGDHGPHGLIVSPDGAGLVIVSGNHSPLPIPLIRTAPPQKLGGTRVENLHAHFETPHWSRVPPNWDEDLLLPRLWDPVGHAREVLAPGGWVARTDPEGSRWEVLATGLRNAYDIAALPNGELFVHDSNMEWDLGLPWYRPTRVLHVVSGAEFGWRSGSGKWPEYFPDSLPSVLQTGPGSPTGMLAGTHLNFPDRYRRGVFTADWTYGRISWLDLQPAGASYTALSEDFLTRSGLPVTDLVAGADGALYFIVGGRGTTSSLYRVTYVDELNEPPPQQQIAATDKFTDLQSFRRQLETTHQQESAENLSAEEIRRLVAALSSSDRHVRYAARIGLEHQPASLWREQVLQNSEVTGAIEGVIALARQGTSTDRERLVQRWLEIEPQTLDESLNLSWLRALQLVIVRTGFPKDYQRDECLRLLDSVHDNSSTFVALETLALQISLRSPGIRSEALSRLEEPTARPPLPNESFLEHNFAYGAEVRRANENPPDARRVQIAMLLRNVRDGWSLSDLDRYHAFIQEARGWDGGTSYQRYLTSMEKSFAENLPAAQRSLLEMRLEHAPPAQQPPTPRGPGRTWTQKAVLAALRLPPQRRTFVNGLRAFHAARCSMCHRVAMLGGATGPDLTEVRGRFAQEALVSAILDPGQIVPDAYRIHQFQLVDGSVLAGRVLHESASTVTILTNSENPMEMVEIPVNAITARIVTQTSPMPTGLLNVLNQDELLDLFAFLQARGDSSDSIYQRPPAR